jgi:diketogulonate reductase-like aldo/keto reductase
VVKAAILEHGYRLIDTASFYKNEEGIGRALKECFAQGIKREDIFITTKIHQSEKEDVAGALKRSLDKLQLHYVDLYLVHWMFPKVLPEADGKPMEIFHTKMNKVWPQKEEIHRQGLAKNIGASNCSVAMLVDILR